MMRNDGQTSFAANGAGTQSIEGRLSDERDDVRITFRATGALKEHLRFVRRQLGCLLGLLRIRKASWHIRIVRDAEMKRLHARTLSLHSTTDVLTFDLRDDRPEEDHEGAAVDLDTVICMDEARRRALELGHPLRNELLLYCVHSLLHVQGYNDTTAAGARRMHVREDELLEALGIGAVYGVGDKGPVKKSKIKKPKSIGGSR